MVIQPTAPVVDVGGRLQLTVNAFDAAGNQVTGRTPTWRPAATGLVTVDATGMMSGLAAGGDVVSVVVDGVSAQASVTVRAVRPSPIALPMSWPAASIPDPASLLSQDFDESGDVSVRAHTGLDIRTGTATPVLAAADGWLVAIQLNGHATCPGSTNCDHGMGNTIILGHALSTSTTIFTQYSHLADGSLDAGLQSLASSSCVVLAVMGRTQCAEGAVHVKRGARLGIAGGTGNGAAGPPVGYVPHLHFEVKASGFLGGDQVSHDTGPFGYADPPIDAKGFLDPMLWLTPAVPQTSGVVWRPTTQGVGNSLRMGPGGYVGGAINGRFRGVNALAASDVLTATHRAAHPAGIAGTPPISCSDGWLRVLRTNGVRFDDIAETDPGKVGRGATTDAWVCQGDNGAPFLTQSAPCAAPTVIQSSINGSQVWSAGQAGCVHYRVTRSILVQGDLRVTPGTIVEFASSAGLNVSGSLSAIGTSTARIHFRGEQAVRGFWEGIRFSSSSTVNELTHVMVAHGGLGTNNSANVSVAVGARLRLTDSELRESGGFGFSSSPNASLSQFQRNVFQQNMRAGIRIPDELLGSLDAASDYLTGNGDSYIDAFTSGVSGPPQVWSVRGVPIRVTGLPGLISTSISIVPGARFTFGSGSGWRVSGSLVAIGTATDKIRFEGEAGTPGYWDGLTFSSNSSASELTHTVVAHGGKGGLNPANIIVQTGASLRITQTESRESAGAGLYIAPGASLPAFSANSFRNNLQAGVRLPDELLGSVDDASDYLTGNGVPFLDAYTSGVSGAPQTWRVVAARVRISGLPGLITTQVTIAPGAQFVFGSGAGWIVSGSLTAIGTANARIRFVGESAIPGYWNGLSFSSNHSANELTFAEVAHAGKAGLPPANVTVQVGARLRLTNTILRDGAGWGLFVGASGVVVPAPVSGAGNTFTGNALGGSNVP